MLTESQRRLSESFEHIAHELDISPSDFERAVNSYRAVGSWLEDGFASGAYSGSKNIPKIYTQGSLKLGTVVRPIRGKKDAAYDVDIVCELQVEAMAFSPENAQVIKHQVGDRLNANEIYRRRLESEKRRCWTIEYAKTEGVGFHIDIVPCVPNPNSVNSITREYGQILGKSVEYLQSMVAITDKKNSGSIPYIWSSSNPLGFAKWFAGRNITFQSFSQHQKATIFENSQRPTTKHMYESLEQVPDELVRTPLQRTVQILKRHRDLYFKNAPEYQPISIIITSLTALLYEGEMDLYTAVDNVTRKLGYYHVLLENQITHLHEEVQNLGLIQRRPDGKWYVPNPVDPSENFADRWHENNNARAKAFFEWISNFGKFVERAQSEVNSQKRAFILNEVFGENYMEKAPNVSGSSHAALFGATISVPHIEIQSPSKPWGHHAG